MYLCTYEHIIRVCNREIFREKTTQNTYFDTEVLVVKIVKYVNTNRRNFAC